MMQLIHLGCRGEPVKEVQRALVRAGHDIIVDGEFGRITEMAVKMFQAAHKLKSDGLVGQITMAALNAAETRITNPPTSSILSIIPHLAIARSLSGIAEIPGPRSNPLILEWVDEIGRLFPAVKPNISWYRDDDTAWCGLAGAISVAKAGFCPPFAPLAARNWLTWGIELVKPILGAALIFRRPGGGHFGFYEGEDSSTFFVRGGNQGNRFCVTRVRKARHIGTRWPAGLPIPTDLPAGMFDDLGDTISTNEA